MRLEFDVIGSRAVRDNNAPLLLDDAGLTVRFNGLNTGGAVLGIYDGTGIKREYTLDSNEVTIPRGKLKVGVLRMDLTCTDTEGNVSSIIICPPIVLHSVKEQIKQPLVAYTEIDEVLKENAELKAAYDKLTSEVEQLKAMLDSYQAQTTTALNSIRGAYKLNLFGGSNNE